MRILLVLVLAALLSGCGYNQIQAKDEAVTAAKTLSGAKSVQEVIELQSKYAKSSMEAYVSEVNLMTETLSASFKDTFKPLNTRITAAVEKFQSYR